MYLSGCKPESSLFSVVYILLIHIPRFLLCFVPSEDLLYLIFLDVIMSLRILKVLKMFLGLERYVVSFLLKQEALSQYIIVIHVVSFY